MRLKYIFLVAVIGVFTKAPAQSAVGTWSNTGPVLFPVNMTGQVDGMGRVCQLKFHPTNPNKMYAVSASGGLFITEDNGNSWAPTHGTEMLPTTACSAVCVDYTNDSNLYLSTGDQNYYDDDYGVWKTTDAGYTWNPANTNIGNRMAVEIIMDPQNHNNLVAATDDGIWRTTNGGSTWTETFTGGKFRSMKQRPLSNNVLYAATDTLFYMSADMGATWTNITAGVAVPVGNGGIRIAVTPADTNIVFLGTTDGYGEILKSADGGNTFTNIYTSTTQCIVCYDSTITSGSQGYYNFNLTVNPTNPNELLLVSHCVWRSTDGGLTWSWRTQWWDQVHTDMHDIEFNPYNLSQRFNANDGGVWLSTDTLATNWLPSSTGLSCTEVYHAAQSPVTRQMISMGSQDNGELYFDGVWRCNRGGDWGEVCNMDYLGKATTYYPGTGNRRDLAPLSGDYTFNSPFIPDNSAQIEFLPLSPNTAFAGLDTLWRSQNINAATPAWQQLFVTGNNIVSINSCTADSNILYVVTNNNHLYRSDNALSASPTFTTYSTPGSTNVMASIATSKYNANVVYLSCNHSIFRSVNKGASWTNITGALPAVNILKVIVDQYSQKERTFVTEGNYVYYKDTTTTTWTNTTGLPSVPRISDMMIYNDSTAASILRVSTYGRGVWETNIQNDVRPVASFAANKQYLCIGDTVRYLKNMYGNITSFSWSFPGGVPATSTADSPVVVYPTLGTYNATLTVIGAAGNDTVIKLSYIVVSKGATAPITEGFEEAFFPPTQWNELSQSGVNWQQTSTAGGYGLSGHCMWFDNFDNSTNGRHDRIITPKIDLTHADTAYMTFDVAYAFYPGYPDSLLVDVSDDCGKTFTTVYAKDSTILATTSDTTNTFIPSATQWRTDTVSLTSYLGSSDVEIAFDNVGHYGQNIYVDNVNIHMSSKLAVANISNNSEVEVFPNPTTGLITLKGQQLNGDHITVSCYNMLGDLVRQKNLNLVNGNLNAILDLTGVSDGVYTLELQTAGGDRIIKKVTVQ